MNNQKRYTLVRIFCKYKDTILGINHIIDIEEIYCKTIKEAIDLWGYLNEEEKTLGSYIIDNVTNIKVICNNKENILEYRRLNNK